jgi:hypothetical protein
MRPSVRHPFTVSLKFMRDLELTGRPLNCGENQQRTNTNQFYPPGSFWPLVYSLISRSIRYSTVRFVLPPVRVSPRRPECD